MSISSRSTLAGVPYGAGISLARRRPARDSRCLAFSTTFSNAAPRRTASNSYASSGHLIANLPTPRLAGPDVPGGGAIMRPVLAAILAEGDAGLEGEGAPRGDLPQVRERGRRGSGPFHRRFQGRI